MKKLKIISTIFIIITILLSTIVLADDQTETIDFSRAEFEISYQGENHSSPELLIKNIPIDKLDTNCEYYVLAYNEKNTEVNINNTNVGFIGSINKNGENEQKINYYNHLNNNIELNNNIYINVVEHNNLTQNNNVVLKDKELTRKELLPLGKRITGVFQSDSTSTFLHEAHYTQNTRKVKLGFGLVEDKDILASIKNKESDALNKLLTYSKTATALYTTTVNLGNVNRVIGNIALKENSYYYVYMQMVDEDGKYYPIEDIYLYQSHLYTTGDAYLVDYLNREFSWGSEGNASSGSSSQQGSTNSPTQSNGYTGSSTQNNGSTGGRITSSAIDSIKSSSSAEAADTTQAKTENGNIKTLPKTGKGKYLIITMIIIALSTVLIYIKKRNYNDI